MPDYSQISEEYGIALNHNRHKANKYFMPPHGKYVTWWEAELFRKNIVNNIDEIISLLIFLRQHTKLNK